MEKLPFSENIVNDVRYRVFLESVDNEDLKWHVDNEDRIIRPSHETNWMIQMDNELPKKLNVNEDFFIPKGIYHRIIKGDGDLTVKVKFI